jgi:hypothetical protein
VGVEQVVYLPEGRKEILNWREILFFHCASHLTRLREEHKFISTPVRYRWWFGDNYFGQGGRPFSGNFNVAKVGIVLCKTSSTCIFLKNQKKK